MIAAERWELMFNQDLLQRRLQTIFEGYPDFISIQVRQGVQVNEDWIAAIFTKVTSGPIFSVIKLPALDEDDFIDQNLISQLAVSYTDSAELDKQYAKIIRRYL